MADEPFLFGGSSADQQDDSSLAADAGKAFLAGTTDTVAQGAGLIAKATDAGPDDISTHVRDLFNEITDTVDKNIAPKNKAAMDASVIPGDGEQSVFTSPGKSVVMKGARMLPQLLGAFLLPEGWAGVAAGSTFFGTQGVAQQINESRKAITAMPDEDLQAKSEPYRQLRQQGMDEGQAKEELLKKQNDLTSMMIAGVAGAVGGGAVGHALKGQAEKGILKSMGVGALDGTLGGAAQGAGSDIAKQEGEISAGIRQGLNPSETLKAGVNAGAELGFVGGAFGGVAGLRNRKSLRGQDGKITDEIAPTPEQKQAIQQHFEPDQNATPEAPEPPQTQPPSQPQGSLAQQIAAERAKQGSEVQAPMPPPDQAASPSPSSEAAPAPVPPVAPVVHPEPARAPEAPTVEPPVPQPAAPLTAREVNAALAEAPKKEPPIPLPPTDRQLAPNPRKGPPERIAVPVDEHLEALNAPPKEAEPEVVPAAAEASPVTPAGKAPEAPAPRSTLRAAFVEKPESKAPTATLVKAEPGKPRVFRTVDPAVEAARKAKTDEETAVMQRDLEASGRRDRRLRNEILPNEKKAEDVIKGSHPEDVEMLQQFHAEEEAALGGKPNTEQARGALLARARKIIALAEDAGVTVPRKTTWTKELREKGEKNPTPYTTRLIELARFERLMTTAARIADPAKREDAMRTLVADHVHAERAVRQGDLAKASQPRLDRNAEISAKRRETGEVPVENAEDEVGTAESRASKFITGDDVPEGGTKKTTVQELLQPLHDRLGKIRSGKGAEHARLMQQIIKKVIEHVGDQEVHLADDNVFFGYHDKVDPETEGIFRGFKRGRLSKGERGELWIRKSILDTIEAPRVQIHEAVHAATFHAIEHNRVFREEIEGLMQHVKLRFPEIVREHGFKDAHEFMAEAMANPRFQKMLMETPAPTYFTNKYKLDQGTSLWRTMINAVARALGLGREHASVLDAMFHIGDELMAYEPPITNRSLADLQLRMPERADAHASLPDRVKDRAKELRPHIGPTLKSKLRSVAHKLTTHTQLGEMLDKYVPDNGGTKLARLMGKMAHEKEHIIKSGDQKLVGDMAIAQRQHAGDTWNKFGSLLHDETVFGAFADKPLADQKHLGKDAMAGWQAKAQHANLSARYAALPADLQALRGRLHDYFRKRQNDMSLERIKNIVRVLNDGVPDDGLAQRIFEKKLDPAEEKVLSGDGVMKSIREARLLNRISGPYVPLMRHGEHVVAGRYEITSPGNARRLDEAGKPDAKGNVFEFDTRDEAKAFAEKQELKVNKVQKVYTDPSTGERFAVDEDGEKVRLGPAEAKLGQAKEAYRVHVQDRHLEFHESEMEARQRLRELRAHPGLTMEGLQVRRWEPNGPSANFMSEAFNRAVNSLRQRQGFKELDEEAQRELVRQLQEASLAALGSTRAASGRLPRTFVAGASHDIQKNTAYYASSSAGYLSRLRFTPQIDAQLKALTDHDRAYKYEADERTQPRGQILKEMKQRLYQMGEPEPNGFWHGVGNRLLQLSFLDKLASPAFHVINSAEPWTISMPILGGRHGMGRTIGELNKAYRDIGGLSAVQAGIHDTGRAFKTDYGLTDYVRRFTDRLRKAPDGKHVVEMLNELHDVGLISRDAGLELGRMANPGGNILGRGLDRADLMARQMGVAIESINRAVTATAAYRLEYAKTKDHAKAVDYAIRTVHDTMGDYSGWNSAPAFKHPVGRLALQFKKYAQKTYYLLGKTALAAFKGDPEAMKAFAGVMATHALLAGGLGLPLEVIKAGFLAANLLGATSSSYGDFEQWVRQQAAGMLGAGGGEIATRGLPRYLGVDLSSRVGLENLILPFGDPKSLKTDDLLAYGAKAFAGAPFSMLAEYPHGIQALWKGDVVEAARVLLPIKLFADSMQAYQRATVGKQTPSGRQSLEPYSPGEALTKVLGFTPGREAETGEMRAAIQGDQRKLQSNRTQLISQWVTARPADKAAMWRQIQEYNRGLPSSAQITMRQLTDAQQRRTREDQNSDFAHGYKTSKRDRFLRDEERTYNVAGH